MDYISFALTLRYGVLKTGNMVNIKLKFDELLFIDKTDSQPPQKQDNTKKISHTAQIL